MRKPTVVVLGIFMTDLAFRADRLPLIGETIKGQGFAIGPGGKGSNQVIAASRAGAHAKFIGRIGKDSFGDLAIATWTAAGVDATHVIIDDAAPTGAAFIFVSAGNGDNAIIIESGAGGRMSVEDLRLARRAFIDADVFITQLEQSLPVAMEGLRLAKESGLTTILNPAPAFAIDDEIYRLCDYITPNETEAFTLTGVAVETEDDAGRAGDVFLKRGVRNVVITLGGRGAYLHGEQGSVLVPSFPVAKVVDTTGAGDAFHGGFATALAEGASAVEAIRFGCAAASLSVQRSGAGTSSPQRADVDAVLKGQG